MARTIKAKKTELFILTSLTIPASCISNANRYLSVKRAVKESIKEFMAERDSVLKAQSEEIQELQKIYQEKKTALKDDKDKEEKIKAIDSEFREKVNEVQRINREKLQKLIDETDDEVEATFDNEDLNAYKEDVKKNATKIFLKVNPMGVATDEFDEELAEAVFKLLDSAK